MRIRIASILALFFIAGGFSVAGAQQTTRIKNPKNDVTPSYTYKGDWYGLVTCNRLQRQGHHVTPDEVKKCVAAGGSYILAAPGRMDIVPKEKLEPFAGQQVWVTGTLTSQKYGTGPTSDESIEGLYAGGDRPATKFEGIKILTIKATKRDDAMVKYDRVDADLGARVSDKALK